MRLAILLINLFSLGLVHSQEKIAEKHPHGFAMVESNVRLQSRELKETSGMAESRRHEGFLWMLNDSGSEPVLHLVGKKGEAHGKLSIKGVKNKDWEDLAAFRMDKQPYLLIADSGDNDAKRDEVVLHIVAEPEFDAKSPLKLDAKVAWSVKYRYPDGSRDCEGVAVDEKAGKIILISKRTTPPEVYELPLKPKEKEVVVAKKIGTTKVSLPLAGIRHPYAEQPTAFDISSDGSKAAVLTYVGVFLFERKENESWADALKRNGTMLTPHGLAQAESVAFSDDGCTIFCTSEGVAAKVVRYKK